MSPDFSHVLFICTGNYYRSRFAEYLFNYLVPRSQPAIPWRAFSRGLAIEQVSPGAGNLSPFTLQALSGKGIKAAAYRPPIALGEKDLALAKRVIALKHAEHFPLMGKKFPHWQERIEYWHVHDIDFAHPDQALPEIESLVTALLEALIQNEAK